VIFLDDKYLHSCERLRLSRSSFVVRQPMFELGSNKPTLIFFARYGSLESVTFRQGIIDNFSP
jgi:hypothetical protein